MFPKSRIAACSMAAIIALSLAACGNQSANTATSSAAPQSSTAAGMTSAPTNLEITSWGPDRTNAGVVFNKQPNGSAALWIRVNQSLDGDVAAVKFNGVLLQGNISGNLVTTGVPADLYANPGAYKVHVIVRKGGQTSQSNDVTFSVQ